MTIAAGKIAPDTPANWLTLGAGVLALERKDRGGARGAGSKGVGGASGSQPKSVPGDLGSALRSAYEQTVSEDVPADLLDLLGKLA